MWIRSQNKKELVDIKRFSIAKAITLGGKKKDPTILIYGYVSSTLTVELGKYFTEEEALLELDNIQKFMCENPNGIYEIN